jgi:hypothetical protein
MAVFLYLSVQFKILLCFKTELPVLTMKQILKSWFKCALFSYDKSMKYISDIPFIFLHLKKQIIA